MSIKRKKSRIIKDKITMNINNSILIILIILLAISIISFNSNYLTGIFENTYRNKYERKISEEKLSEMLNELNIQENKYIWNSPLEYGNKPKVIVIHHSASEASVDKVHDMHKNERGWNGIGYHFYIESDGTINRGRPEDAIGAHVKGHNKDTLGICLQGNFEEKTLVYEQENSLINLLTYLSFKYPIGEVKGHKDLAETLCPGKNNSIDDIINKLDNNMKNISK